MSNGTVFTLKTRIGEISLLVEVAGIGAFREVLAASEKWNVHGFEINAFSIRGQIRAKRAAGRFKDEEGIKLLKVLEPSELDEE